MPTLDSDCLRRLGSGERIAEICRSLSISREEFNARWEETVKSRVPKMSGRHSVEVQGNVEIERDKWGIPHIYAGNDANLFFGFGYAQAQDRLFQLDYLRRKGSGRLAEILGNEGLASDLVARTVGLNRIAAEEWERLPRETQNVLAAFASGVNAFVESAEIFPIEFDLLDYRPEPWTPLDSLAIEVEFRWYLTGRFPVIVIPELARRVLGNGPLYEEFLLAEADGESILHPGEYTPRAAHHAGLPTEPVGHTVGDPDSAIGSNNWVLGSARTTTGSPLLASDPHIAIEAVSCWYEAHLCGGSFNVAGMGYAGMPAIMFGRNPRVAWGITNNICSLRDLYQEQTSPEHPRCFLFDGRWEPERTLVETIRVRGGEPVEKTVRFSRNGPIVDEILPAAAQGTGPVSLNWLGHHQGGWLMALLGMGRATTCDEFRAALRPWHVPTFSLVFADVDGHIGLQTSGRIPVRKSICRGYRPGWDPEHQWQGLIPFEQMPGLADPPRGWIATANNRLAPNDYPYLLFGCWSSGLRAARIRQMIESQTRHTTASMVAMQQDARSLRAADLTPALVALLKEDADPRVKEAAALLAAWNCDIEIESPEATIFNVFFSNWCKTVANERFAVRKSRLLADSPDTKPDASGYYEPTPAIAELVSGGMPGLAGRLLKEDRKGWFAPDTREARIRETFVATLEGLAARFGPDIQSWHWGRLHKMTLAHVLSFRGDLGELLSQGRSGVRGDMVTVNNTGSGPDFVANSGAGYRLIADLSASPPVLLAVGGESQSGHPGSPNYGDQFDDWSNARYHEIPLDRAAAAKGTVDILRLEPRG